MQMCVTGIPKITLMFSKLLDYCHHLVSYSEKTYYGLYLSVHLKPHAVIGREFRRVCECGLIMDVLLILNVWILKAPLWV